MQEFEWEWISEFVPRKGNILDLGFGDGISLKNLTQIVDFEKGSICLLEGAESLVSKARDLFGDKVNVIHTLFEEYVNVDSFDFIIASHVFEHVDDPQALLENLYKNAYYNIVTDSLVVFNCALQDWVSNTVSEADALGCNVLYPAYRSFPETFANDHNRLYVPWSIDDALDKLDALLESPHPDMGRISDYNDGTIDRIIDILEGNGEDMLRMSTDYRKHTRETKY
jgi:SAM-dependent methyltransferase